MHFSKSFLFNKIFLLFFVLVIITGCGSGGGGSSGVNPESETAPALEDPENTFSTVGISSTDELKEKISTIGTMRLMVDIQKAGDDISSEKIIGLFRTNNRNIEYKKIESKGIDPAIIEKLKKLKYSPVSVKQSVQLPDPDIFPMPNLTDEALSLLNQDKLKRLNRKLQLSGQTPLGMEEFLKLQEAFTQVDIVDNFGNLDQQFQNILARDTIDRSKSRLKSPAISKRLKEMTPTGYTLINAVDELKVSDAGADFHIYTNSCQINRIDLPMLIAQPNDPIDTNLVTSESETNDAILIFPETGIAVILVSGSSQDNFIMKDSAGIVLDNRLLDNTYIYYLPITKDDLCKPFRFVGASKKFSVTLVDMIKSERINDHTFLNGSEYISSLSAAELINENTFFNAKSYTFSTINSTLPDLDILFEWNTNDESEASFNFILYAPNGEVHSGTQTAEGEINLTNIPRQSGIWRLDILPADSITIDTNSFINHLKPQISKVNNDISFDLTTMISTDNQVQTKEFVLGTLKNISLKTQGETGSFNEGEVSIDLNTNMSPKLNIPSYIDDIINSGDEMNDNIALWQSWKNSEKTGYEFNTGGECEAYKEEFLRRKHLYEVSHTVDYQNDPEVYQCRDENGEEAECIRGELGPYNMKNPTEPFKVQVVMNDYSKDMQRQYQDVEYLNILSNYYDLYQNWKERTVQVDNGQFPYDGLPYKTHEFGGCESGDTECLTNALNGEFPRIPVIIQTNRPIFGVPVERVNESTLPISFDYTASDQDVYDVNSANWAFLSFVASQALNAVTGNFVNMICDTVDLVDDLHDVELAAEDDPLGSARASINRYSSSDPFYGLHNQDSFRFFMSGLPEKNTDIDTYGQKLNYAQIACGVANIATSGYQFAQNTDLLLNFDCEQLADAADVYKIIAGTSTAVNSALIMDEAEEIAGLIRQGNIEAAKQRLKTSSSVNTLTTGKDLYDNLDSLLAAYQAVGSAGNGNNVLKSNAKYLLGTGKKTRAEVEFERVSSVPVAKITVALNRVKIISNYEKDDKAEINLIPFVGIISDKPSSSDTAHNLFSDTEDIRDGNHTWDYLSFNNVADGQTLETPDTILYSESACGNVAALYLELAIKEEDSISLEDDDMIGIFSQTIKLEEIFNKNADFKWTSKVGNEYQLLITDYPVYNSSNQLSLENPLSDDYQRQKSHNNQRKPGALVTFTIDVTMGDINTNYPVTNTGLNLGLNGTGRDTYSMEMRAVREMTINGSLLDVFKSKAIVGDESYKSVTGTILSYGVDPYFLQELFTYDVNAFTGDLAPIKEALSSTKSIGRTFWDSENNLVNELSLVQLLSNNRLLFVMSHDLGARIMIVSYNDAGVMVLEKSFFIEDLADSAVNSLLNSTLSPDRTRLIVPYVPTDYAGSDKKQPAYTRLNLYQIGEDNSIRLLSADAFGNGAPITNVEFIDESHIAVLTQKLLFGTEGGAGWPDWVAVQETCTSDSLDCLFGKVDKNILLFTINDNNRLELTDSLSIFDTPSYENYLKNYSPLKTILTVHNSQNDLQRVSTIKDASSILRLGLKLYQLNFDSPTGGYYFGDSSSYQNVKSLRYNGEGCYYCADGITCSGYLSSALQPSRDDTTVYKSEDRIRGFEFADTDRDLVLGFAGDKLQLLSLYDGAAYKGPRITGDIFDTRVFINGSDTLGFSFTITDRDTPLEQLIINVRAATVNAPNGYDATHISTIKVTDNGNGGYDCTGTISTDAFDDTITLDQTIIASISDGTYTTEKEFSIYHKPSILIQFADADNGIEVWKTDGNTAGTEILNDANPIGDSLSFYSGLYRFNKHYFYLADSGDGENQPFVAKADGEAKPLKEGLSGAAYTAFMAFGNHVYFRTSESSENSTLWQTDGTADGTVSIKTISSGKITQFFNFDNALYFFVNGKNSSAADELWKSDGTSAGTTLVKGSLYYENYAAVFNGKLFFSARLIGGTEIGLWVSDGTTIGTYLLKDFGTLPIKLIDVDDMLYFQNSYQITDGNNNTVTYMDLWKTDGSDTGTVLVKSDSKQGLFDLKQMFIADNILYFVKDDVLWKSDGTEDGTIAVKTLYTLPAYNQLRTPVKVVNDTIYFNIQKLNPLGYSLYAMNPSANGDLIEVDATHYDMVTFYNELLGNNYFIYSSEDETHYYLWKHNIDDGKTLIKQTDK